LYGCETWSILRKELRLTVFENGMLRKVLSVAKLGGGMQNKDLCNLCSSPKFFWLSNEGM